MATRKVTISQEAALDIDRIADSTIARWGSPQARSYIATLRVDIESLGRFPERFPSHHGRYSQLRKMRSGHHVVFYQVFEARVHVIRVLHERMHFDPKLG